MTYLAEELAHFAIGCSEDDIPTNVWDAARRSVLDTIASCLGGVPTQNAALTRQAARTAFGSGAVKAWFSDEPGFHPLGALLSNCAAASALDIDDGHRGAAGHPGAAIIPAAIQFGTSTGAGGRQIFAAIIVGYEVSLRVAESRHMPDDVSFASGIWTGYGVAAALSRLRGLSPQQTAHAIAIAAAEAPQNLPQGACMASSVKGSSPWSTVTAAVSVERAACGATGSIDLLDRPAAFRTKSIAARLGSRWLITETYFKPYASCRYTHPVIDAILAIIDENSLTDAPIDGLEIEIFPEAERLSNAIAPTSLEDAQFSIPFTAALAATRGIEAFRPLRPEALTDRDTLELSQRVKITYSHDFPEKFPLGTPARVTITSGELQVAKYVPMPLGDATNPLSDDALRTKLYDLGHDMLHRPELELLVAAIGNIDSGEACSIFEKLTALNEELTPNQRVRRG